MLSSILEDTGLKVDFQSVAEQLIDSYQFWTGLDLQG
jgi:hypothetical protein